MAAGQGITKPHGIGGGPGIWKPDIQMPIPEKVTPHITMEPYTYFKPAMEFHTKGARAWAGSWLQQLLGASMSSWLPVAICLSRSLMAAAGTHARAQASACRVRPGSCRVRMQSTALPTHTCRRTSTASKSGEPRPPAGLQPAAVSTRKRPVRNACSAATRCTGPFGKDKPNVGVGQFAHTGVADFTVDAIQEAPAQYWGGDAGTVCNTVLLKPIMTCGDGCISDNRLYGDWCLCPSGLMPCPYNAQGTGYQWCQCEQLGPPYGLCVADSYYCAYYCQYAPSWIFTAIAKGAMLCPIDPTQIDPYNVSRVGAVGVVGVLTYAAAHNTDAATLLLLRLQPDPVYPGWDTTTNWAG